MCVVKFVQSDMNDEILLRECHVLIHLPRASVRQSRFLYEWSRGNAYLKCVIEVSHFAKIVEELVDTGLVVLDEWVQRDHVRFFRIRRLVGQILEHLRNLQPT